MKRPPEKPALIGGLQDLLVHLLFALVSYPVSPPRTTFIGDQPPVEQ